MLYELALAKLVPGPSLFCVPPHDLAVTVRFGSVRLVTLRVRRFPPNTLQALNLPPVFAAVHSSCDYGFQKTTHEAEARSEYYYADHLIGCVVKVFSCGSRHASSLDPFPVPSAQSCTRKLLAVTHKSGLLAHQEIPA